METKLFAAKVFHRIFMARDLMLHITILSVSIYQIKFPKARPIAK